MSAPSLRLLGLWIVLLGGLVAPRAAWAEFPLSKGDSVCLVGNTLAERMQHDGWLETLVQARFPDQQLTFRNLGFSGDELTLRLRSSNFGSPDEWLTRCQADVVVAMFGYNESYSGEEGLEKFRGDLRGFLESTRRQKYNGESPPRIVLVSPVAHESLPDPNLPNPGPNNRRLALYTQAMREVAGDIDGVWFVDLYEPTLGHEGSQPLTFNGIHLTEHGNRFVAERMVEALFGPSDKAMDEAALARIRAAVQDKNFYWFHRYRTTDGFSVFGGRSGLKFVDGQTNREVMQREMEVLDVMTANRDAVVWAAAEGRAIEADDSNLPPFIPVVTNKPGPLPGGEHLFLGGDAALEKMKVADGFEVTLFASEEDFPELINPVQMAFDTQGRLWVATWPTYPHWKPGEPMNDSLLILEDTTGDGRADRATSFADDLHNPTGFEFYGRGVFVAMMPDILYLEDTTGDGKADLRLRVLHGIDSADTHHAANSFVLGPGGDLYFQEGTFHHTQVETPHRRPVRSANAGAFRYEPLTHKFEVFVAHGFANPHGHVIDRWGQGIMHDGTGAVPYHTTLFSGHVEFPTKHARPPRVYAQRTRPCSGTELVSGGHFPESMRGNLLVLNVIGFQGILQYELNEDGASYQGQEVTPLVSSSDPNFRPADLEIGPDGALYFCDWHNPIIGHMQHNLRDPSRDRKHGRVYRLRHTERPLDEPVAIAGESIDTLVSLLARPEDRVRYRAKIELAGRDPDAVLQAVNAWLARLNPSDPDVQHHVLEGLWMHQYLNRVSPELLERVLGLDDHRARAAAVRVLCAWRDRIADGLDHLRAAAADEHPLVRLEAVRAASFFDQPEAMEVVLVAEEQTLDEYLQYTIAETRKTLDNVWKRAIESGAEIAVTTPEGERALYASLPTEALVEREQTRGVVRALLFRPGLSDELRRGAIERLAELEQADPLTVLLAALEEAGGHPRGEQVIVDFARLLSEQPREQLAEIRGKLQALAEQSPSPLVRQIGQVSLIIADGDVEQVWQRAQRSTQSLIDLVAAMPLIPDPGLKAALYPKVLPLLDGLPEALATDDSPPGTLGRFVRVELPGQRRTLTLAEVEVYSGGTNIARRGKARQSDTGFGGTADRGIDGKTSGRYGDGGQTHTSENQRNPWWEVDLGDEYPIERIVIFNRTEGDFGKRLDGFTLKVLDAGRNEIWSQQKLPAPKTSDSYDVGVRDPASLVRRAAMQALVTIRGKEGEVFGRVAAFLDDNATRNAAVQALQRIPPRFWPEDQLEPLAERLVSYVEGIPTEDRNAPSALDAMQLADALAARLPAEPARALRQRLGEVSVRVLRITAVPHRMAYDQEHLAVTAGKPLQIIFENPDIMPHNLVILKPGTLAEIGEMAEATAQDPATQARGYAPKSPHVLLASELLQGQQSQVLTFTAPSQPGVYPFVCTYPGHWRRMYGALYVVEDLEAYSADPVAYLAKHDLTIQDELLELNRPRTEWTVDDLKPALEELNANRSFARGKHLFEVASCLACHKVHGSGNAFGPALDTLEAKVTPAEILESILEPSAKIDDKYRSHTFVMDDGRVVNGMIVASDETTVRVIENPLSSAEPVALRVDAIDERVPSEVSLMPKGLLEKLTRDEILDLLAYVVARGNEKHPIYAGGHGHGHHHDH